MAFPHLLFKEKMEVHVLCKKPPVVNVGNELKHFKKALPLGPNKTFLGGGGLDYQLGVWLAE